uniref:Odorant receptor n=1 Tax=Aulacocentrum confusum TaxID=2767324 RepID=A0A7G8Z948_9HYME|nr:olfactory receptor 29 [Aulacocentrum confusum]
MINEIKAKSLHMKTLLEASKPLRVVGIWPTNHTTITDIRFAIIITYYTIFVVMEYCDLFYVFGDLELVILNLLETTYHTVIITRIYMIRFNGLVRQVIKDIEDDHDEFYGSEEEKKITIECHAIGVSSYATIMFWIVTGISAWYLTPVTNYIIARLNNETGLLILPYRIPTFFNLTSFKPTAGIYMFEMGLNYFAVCLGSSCNVLSTAVNNVCCRLAVLTYRVKNLKLDADGNNHRQIFRNLCASHLRTMRLIKTIDNAFHLTFLSELLLLMTETSVILYNIIHHWDNMEIVYVVSLSACCVFMISIIGINCVMGQNLLDKSLELNEAYWQCIWYDMPVSGKKLFMILMISSQSPLQLTAGKFYLYSLSNFVSILKTCVVYASILRTVQYR